MPDETPHARAPDLRDQLAAFNEARRQFLGGKPIDPEGCAALMPDPPPERVKGNV